MTIWVPLFNLGEVTFGIAGTAWGALAKDGTVASLASCPQAFLPFLELRFEQIDQLVKSSLLQNGIPEERSPPLPLTDAILVGLGSTSAYWQVLALSRIGELPDKTPFEAELRRLASDGATQAVRYQAKSLVGSRRW